MLHLDFHELDAAPFNPGKGEDARRVVHIATERHTPGSLRSRVIYYHISTQTFYLEVANYGEPSKWYRGAIDFS